MNKKLINNIYIIIYIIFPLTIYSAQLSEANINKDYIYNDMENFENVTIKTSKFKIDAQYYGLPLKAKLGWLYRKNDFSIFPNTGVSFFVDEGAVLNTSIGLIIQKKYFTWEVNSVYDIIPFSMNKSMEEQSIYAANNFIFNIYGVKISFPTNAGRLRRTKIYNDGKNETLNTVVTELTQGISLSFFLADLGFFKSTGNTSFFIDWIPKDNFADYRISATVLASFFLYSADIVFSYSIFNTDYIKFNNSKIKQNYKIAKTQEFLTGRSSFKTQIDFTQIHLFGNELRWYPVRIKNNSNGFFISIFTDIGFGFTTENKTKLIAEYGIGGGYTLLDSVPFTFQAGLNQNLQPIFYLGIVSRLTHLP